MKKIKYRYNKILCVDNENVSLSITKGKWYYTIFNIHLTNDSDAYTIISDKGVLTKLSRKYFKTVEELREDKLKELGI